MYEGGGREMESAVSGVQAVEGVARIGEQPTPVL
jgi:hypothetical protein